MVAIELEFWCRPQLKVLYDHRINDSFGFGRASSLVDDESRGCGNRRSFWFGVIIFGRCGKGWIVLGPGWSLLSNSLHRGLFLNLLLQWQFIY